MDRNEILEKVKELDECGIFPYLYDAMTDGSREAEMWLERLEDAEVGNEQELMAELENMFSTR